MKIKDLLDLSYYPYDDICIGYNGLDEFVTMYHYDGYNLTGHVPDKFREKEVVSYAVKVETKQPSMCEINLTYTLYIQI